MARPSHAEHEGQDGTVPALTVLVSPDSLKGALGALDAAEAIAAGFSDANPDAAERLRARGVAEVVALSGDIRRAGVDAEELGQRLGTGNPGV